MKKYLVIIVLTTTALFEIVTAQSYDSLRVKLLHIHNEDQKYRTKIDSVEKAFGRLSVEMKNYNRMTSEKDSLNLIQVKEILDRYGWIGRDKVGIIANGAIFLVIQHADFMTQQKYLPMMRDAAQKGDADPGQLALLEDRVALRKGMKQIYGTQIQRDKVTGKFFLPPLEDPANVDKRRAEVGLGKLKEYLKQWNIEWPQMK